MACYVMETGGMSKKEAAGWILLLVIALGLTALLKVANYQECRAEGHTVRYCVSR